MVSKVPSHPLSIAFSMPWHAAMRPVSRASFLLISAMNFATSLDRTKPMPCLGAAHRGPSRPRLGKSCCFWGLEWSFRNNKNGFNQQKLGFNDEEKGVYMILPAKCGKKPSTYRGLFNESWCCGSEMRYTASHKMLWKPKANIAIGDR